MIKFLFMDVDGTLTDGRIYMAADGELFKVFNIKDGCGIKDILPEYEILPVIITARYSEALKNRCKELGISRLYQGVRTKYEKAKETIEEYNRENNSKFELRNCAYIGDDILDLQCMIPIKKAGGLVGCPADAEKKILDIADFISVKNGGCGAVRDFIEYIISKN